MGKRKKSSRKPTGPKKREPLATVFRCCFCAHEAGVTVKMDRKMAVGNLSCKACGQSFQTSINYLTQPVDVYADWIDACEAVANDHAAPRADADMISRARGAHSTAAASAHVGSSRAGLAPGEKYTAEDEAFIENDEEDVEAEYADE